MFPLRRGIESKCIVPFSNSAKEQMESAGFEERPALFLFSVCSDRRVELKTELFDLWGLGNRFDFFQQAFGREPPDFREPAGMICIDNQLCASEISRMCVLSNLLSRNNTPSGFKCHGWCVDIGLLSLYLRQNSPDPFLWTSGARRERSRNLKALASQSPFFRPVFLRFHKFDAIECVFS